MSHFCVPFRVRAVSYGAACTATNCLQCKSKAEPLTARLTHHMQASQQETGHPEGWSQP